MRRYGCGKSTELTVWPQYLKLHS